MHRAARIAASGHGGQVLVSASTAALVGTGGLRDLGEHRLKDLSAPERIYQLGEGDFPALKSLHRTNLPVPATPFLGRERELREVQELVSRADVRLLTLTGPGGSGKTRLVLQAAAERRSATRVVSSGFLSLHFVTLRWCWRLLGRRSERGTVWPSTSARRRSAAAVRQFEHLTEAAADLAGLLGDCPRLDLLVTSREPLHVSGEQEYPVPTLAPKEGVDFFLARARAVKPDFEGDGAVEEICRRLDDLPLALELAAARVKALSPAQILERLEQRLPLLTGGARDAPERQRTLRATIEWSYDLLTDEEKYRFARLAVFRGGSPSRRPRRSSARASTLAVARRQEPAAACGGALLDAGDDPRVRRRTTRVIQGDGDRLRQRHADYFLRLAQEAEPHLTGPQQAPWLDRLTPNTTTSASPSTRWARDAATTSSGSSGR